jgi:hypothetical protein
MRKDRSCKPPRGKTYLAIGQDLISVHEYMLSLYNASLHNEFPSNPKKSKSKPITIHDHEPHATMVYTDIQTLRGLTSPVDYGSGIEFADGLAQDFPSSAIQLGLWLNGTQGCQDIISGRLTKNVKALFHYLVRDLDTPKVFLRIGYEFDNPSFGYDDPGKYKLAYQSMVNICHSLFGSECRKKIAFVWHSWGAPRDFPLLHFYPGDRYVDWTAVSFFQQLYPWANEVGDNSTSSSTDFAGGSMSQVREVLDFAKQRHKAIMIAESTPFFGMYLQEQDPKILETYHLESKENVDIWKLWFQPVLDLIEEYDIGMWSYISTDWNAQPMWNGTGFGDTRISSSPSVMKHWAQDVLSSSRFHTSLSCVKTHKQHGRPSNYHTTAAVFSSSLMDNVLAKTATMDNGNTTPLVWAVLFVCVGTLFLLTKRLRSSRHASYQQI